VSDFAAEYQAATQALAVFDRSHRTRLVIRGRAPGQMLKGILTGVMPPAPREVAPEVWGGRATYHAVLTPKGRIISDLWATLLGDETEVGYRLDVPAAGSTGLRESLAKLLPPRMAAVDDASQRTAMATAVGPGAAETLSALATDSRVRAADLAALAEGEWRAAGVPSEAVLVQRTADVWPEAYVLVGPDAAVAKLVASLVDRGARRAGEDVWTTLRVEAGRPEFGVDMDTDTLPPEAGIEGSAIDHAKGCYTGQEVIVRIRDRGHVNKKLYRLELGDVTPPASGTELFAGDGSGKPAGRVTSAVRSPRNGGVVALAYVMRGHESVLIDGRAITVPSA
jgi:folate-binding protein YgfZ